MDVLKRIDVLRAERNWTEYQLAQESGLTQSTISTWYRKKMTPTIASLEKLCDAFGITLSEFFLDDGGNTLSLTPPQLRLLTYAAKLNKKQNEALLSFLESL